MTMPYVRPARRTCASFYLWATTIIKGITGHSQLRKRRYCAPCLTTRWPQVVSYVSQARYDFTSMPSPFYEQTNCHLSLGLNSSDMSYDHLCGTLRVAVKARRKWSCCGTLPQKHCYPSGNLFKKKSVGFAWFSCGSYGFLWLPSGFPWCSFVFSRFCLVLSRFS